MGFSFSVPFLTKWVGRFGDTDSRGWVYCECSQVGNCVGCVGPTFLAITRSSTPTNTKHKGINQNPFFIRRSPMILTRLLFGASMYERSDQKKGRAAELYREVLSKYADYSSIEIFFRGGAYGDFDEVRVRLKDITREVH